MEEVIEFWDMVPGHYEEVDEMVDEKKKCTGCGADVVWVRMQKSGKWMILDAKAKQMVRLVENEQTRAMGGGRPLAEVVKVYESHWVTCPVADKFRGKDG
jgi:hypothetical protein